MSGTRKSKTGPCSLPRSTYRQKAPVSKPTIVGFETGAFCLYVERGKEHGPVFDFLVPDIQKAKRQLVAAGCTVIEENPKIPRCYIRDPYGMIFNLEQSSGEK